MRVKNYETTINQRTKESKNISTRCTWSYMNVQSDFSELATNLWTTSWISSKNQRIHDLEDLFPSARHPTNTTTNQNQSYHQHHPFSEQTSHPSQLVHSLGYSPTFYASYSTTEVVTPMIFTSSSPPSSEVNNHQRNCF